MNQSLLIKKPFLLSTCYLAPVEYYCELANSKSIFIEQHENYIKQTFRNRCEISGSNGKLDLTIPIEKNNKEKILIRDVRISTHNKWQSQHWKSIISAYNSSPYFEFLIDDLKPFFEKKWIFLFDFNIEFQQMICDFLEIETIIELTKKYEHNLEFEFTDLRDLIHPKKQNTNRIIPYYQVFEQKFGFIPNLSIVDLIFNMGNESQLILKKQNIK